MSLETLKTKYGKSKKMRQLLNSAIREEIPGSGIVLDTLGTSAKMLNRSNLTEKEKEIIQLFHDKLSEAATAMRDAIYADYTRERIELDIPTPEEFMEKISEYPVERVIELTGVKPNTVYIWRTKPDRVPRPNKRKEILEDLINA